MDKKKTIYQATFEESESFVSDTAVKRAIEQSQPKVVNKRLFGIALAFFIIYLLYLLLEFVENGAPGNMQIFALRVPIIWVVLSLIIYLPYFMIVLKNKNVKKISLSLYYNVVSILYSIILILFIVTFFLALASVVLSPLFVYIFYIGLLVIFTFNCNQSLNQSIEKKLYGNKQSSTNIFDFFQKYQKYFSIIAGLLIVLRIIFSLIFGTENNEQSGFITTVSMALAPLFAFVMVLIPIYLKDEALMGYYISKYSEEYRLKYGYSNLEWYGKKSIEHKNEKNKVS
ncbi:hypothetical protein [Carnobacterium maltaromaticum]|uniref:hypothetical protein n=1 Tax=Carnobacterium maltaromaticum TaxID=2751 RepID=UPI00295F00FA|nr:hypothetical protein [Carnobacterium maltaromaticum]